MKSGLKKITAAILALALAAPAGPVRAMAPWTSAAKTGVEEADARDSRPAGAWRTVRHLHEPAFIVNPGILALGNEQNGLLKKLVSAVAAREDEGANWIHLDVPDGKYTPIAAFDARSQIRAIHATDPKVKTNVHVLLEDPQERALDNGTKNYIQAYGEAGASVLTFHVNSAAADLARLDSAVDEIRSNGMKAGIMIGLDSELDEKLRDWVVRRRDDIAVIAFMAVNPQLSGGLPFEERVVPKIRAAREFISRNGLDIELENDGGLRLGRKLLSVTRAGATMLDTLSIITKLDGSIPNNIERMHREARWGMRGFLSDWERLQEFVEKNYPDEFGRSERVSVRIGLDSGKTMEKVFNINRDPEQQEAGLMAIAAYIVNQSALLSADGINLAGSRVMTDRLRAMLNKASPAAARMTGAVQEPFSEQAARNTYKNPSASMMLDLGSLRADFVGRGGRTRTDKDLSGTILCLPDDPSAQHWPAAGNMLSARGLLRAAADLGLEADSPAALGRLFVEGDSRAKQTMELAARYLAQLIRQVAKTRDIDSIVLGGGKLGAAASESIAMRTGKLLNEEAGLSIPLSFTPDPDAARSECVRAQNFEVVRDPVRDAQPYAPVCCDMTLIVPARLREKALAAADELEEKDDMFVKVIAGGDEQDGFSDAMLSELDSKGMVLFAGESDSLPDTRLVRDYTPSQIVSVPDFNTEICRSLIRAHRLKGQFPRLSEELGGKTLESLMDFGGPASADDVSPRVHAWEQKDMDALLEIQSRGMFEPEKVQIIGMSGAPASGKTSRAELLSNLFGWSLLSTDDFFFEKPDRVSPDYRAKWGLENMVFFCRNLKRHGRALKPVYDLRYPRHSERADTIRGDLPIQSYQEHRHVYFDLDLHNAMQKHYNRSFGRVFVDADTGLIYEEITGPVVVLEGTTALFISRILEHMDCGYDLKLFCWAPHEECVERFYQRSARFGASDNREQSRRFYEYDARIGHRPTIFPSAAAADSAILSTPESDLRLSDMIIRDFSDPSDIAYVFTKFQKLILKFPGIGYKTKTALKEQAAEHEEYTRNIIKTVKYVFGDSLPPSPEEFNKTLMHIAVRYIFEVAYISDAEPNAAENAQKILDMVVKLVNYGAEHGIVSPTIYGIVRFYFNGDDILPPLLYGGSGARLDLARGADGTMHVRKAAPADKPHIVERLQTQLRWINEYVPENLKTYFVKVRENDFNLDPEAGEVYYSAPVFPGKNVSDFLLFGGKKLIDLREYLSNILRFCGHKLFPAQLARPPEDFVETFYMKRIFERLALTRSQAPEAMSGLLDAKTIGLSIRDGNGTPLTRELANAPEILARIDKRVKAMLAPTVLGRGHYDENLQNILLPENQESDPNHEGFLMLDPHGRVLGDLMYTLTKPAHNLPYSKNMPGGYYDYIHRGFFQIRTAFSGGRAEADMVFTPLRIARHRYDIMAQQLPAIMRQAGLLNDKILEAEPTWPLRFLFVEASHFLTMLPFHMRGGDEEEVKALYLMGVLLLNDFDRLLDEYEEMFRGEREYVEFMSFKVRRPQSAIDAEDSRTRRAA